MYVSGDRCVNVAVVYLVLCIITSYTSLRAARWRSSTYLSTKAAGNAIVACESALCAYNNSEH